MQKLLDFLPIATVIITTDGRIVWGNSAGIRSFQRLLPCVIDRLARAARRMSGAEPDGIDLGVFEVDDGPVHVRATRVGACEEATRRADHLFLLVAEERSGYVDAPHARHASEAHKVLTPTEHKLAAQIVAGKSVRDAAGEMGVSYNTARKHMQNMYAKLAVNNRVQLLITLQRMEFERSGAAPLDQDGLAA